MKTNEPTTPEALLDLANRLGPVIAKELPQDVDFVIVMANEDGNAETQYKGTADRALAMLSGSASAIMASGGQDQ